MTQRFAGRVFTIVAATICGSWSLAAAEPAASYNIDEQRALFRAVYPGAELGSWAAVERLDVDDRRKLSAYVLWPDLRAAFFRAALRSAPPPDIDAFLDQYGTLKPARELRYRYALHLAARGRHEDYLGIYRTYYQGRGMAKLDCLALAAELQLGRGANLAARARELWLVGHSQDDACDPVFAWLQDEGRLDVDDYRARYALAIEAREFNLARWLARSIDAATLAAAEAWRNAAADPQRFVERARPADVDRTTLEQLVYAVERLTFRDPELALDKWRTLSARHPFAETQRLETARHIALWTARDGLADAHALLHALPTAASNDEVLRWRARTSLREGRWDELLIDIGDMRPAEREAEQWRYWRAIALTNNGRGALVRPVLEALAGERSYYGFLAADKLNKPYAFEHANLEGDEALLTVLASKPELIRARELFLVGLDGRGRSEWDAAVSGLPPDQKLQAAILANRWGWHSRAIATAASVDAYDDLTLRYPLPFFTAFEQHSTSAQIPATWAYGVARSESLFMRDVRSGAGAVGLMQLLPSTGRAVARDIRLPYTGLDTLTDPAHNIRLGTTYLARMARRYDGNRVLATAAYNAGPRRVDNWIPKSRDLDARIWIENIPFNETRRYVRRVMAAKTIFHWRMTGETRRLSDELPPVAATTAERVASR